MCPYILANYRTGLQSSLAEQHSVQINNIPRPWIVANIHFQLSYLFCLVCQIKEARAFQNFFSKLSSSYRKNRSRCYVYLFQDLIKCIVSGLICFMLVWEAQFVKIILEFIMLAPVLESWILVSARTNGASSVFLASQFSRLE